MTVPAGATGKMRSTPAVGRISFMRSITDHPGCLFKVQALHTLVLFLVLLSTCARADPLSEAREIVTESDRQGAELQLRIDRLDDRTRAMVEEYRRVTAEADRMARINAAMEQRVAAQGRQLAGLEEDIANVMEAEASLLPLLQRMASALDEFVRQDLPFLPGERRLRSEALGTVLDEPGMPLARKLRRALEAWQVEAGYAQSVEAYRAELERDGLKRTVDFLRIGRLSLAYLTLDGAETGYWDHDLKTWVSLPGGYLEPIQEALRVARKAIAPRFIRVPVPAAEPRQ